MNSQCQMRIRSASVFVSVVWPCVREGVVGSTQVFCELKIGMLSDTTCAGWKSVVLDLVVCFSFTIWTCTGSRGFS